MSRFTQEIRFAPVADGDAVAYAVSGRGHPLVRARAARWCASPASARSSTRWRGWWRMAGGRTTPRSVSTTQFFPQATREQADAFNDMQRLSCTPAQAARIVAGFARIDASHHLKNVRCPTLVMHCRGDASIPFEEGRFIAAGIAGARLEILDSPNHVPLPGKPAYATLLELISRFLPSSSPGAGSRPTAASARASAKWWNCSHAGWTTRRSRRGWVWPRRRCAISCRRCSSRSRSRAQAIMRAREAGFGSG